MTTSENFYELLGVERDASQEEIRQRYLELITKHHPDQYRGLRAKYETEGEAKLLELIEEKIREAEAFCASLNVAYDTLSDPQLREFYDAKYVDDEAEAPQIVVTPTAIAFGKLEQDQKCSESFVIENRGGPVSAIDISWEDEPDWGELVITPQPDDIFPIEVTILVDTHGVSPGDKTSTIAINVDGYTHSVSCSLRVASKPIRASPASPPVAKPPLGKVTPLPAAKSGWFPRLAIIVAVIAIVVTVASTALSNNAERERELAHKAELLDPSFVTVQEIGGGPCSDSPYGPDWACAWETTWEVKNETSGTLWYRDSKEAFCNEGTENGSVQGTISPGSSQRFTCIVRPANYRTNPRSVLSPCLKFTYKEWGWNDLSVEACLDTYTSAPDLTNYIDFQAVVLPIQSDGFWTGGKGYYWVSDLSITSTFDQEVYFGQMFLRDSTGQVVDTPFGGWQLPNTHRTGTIQPGQTVALRCSGYGDCRPTGLNLCIEFQSAGTSNTTLCRMIVKELPPP